MTMMSVRGSRARLTFFMKKLSFNHRYMSCLSISTTRKENYVPTFDRMMKSSSISNQRILSFSTTTRKINYVPRFTEMNPKQRRALLHQIFDYYSVANTAGGGAGGRMRVMKTTNISPTTNKTRSIPAQANSFVWWPLRYALDSIVRRWKSEITYEHPFFSTKCRVVEARRHELIEMYRLSLIGDEHFKFNRIETAKISTKNLRRRVYLRILRDSNRRKLASIEIEKESSKKWINSFNDEDTKNLELLISIGHLLRCQRMLDSNTTKKSNRMKPFGFLYDMKNEHLLPRAKFKGQISIVKTSQSSQVRDALSLLEGETVIGFDTETNSQDNESSGPSLIQLSSAHCCVLIQVDTSSLPLELVNFLENEEIVKAGVGVVNDARDLTRSFENVSRVSGLVELQTWAENLHCRPVSLKALTGIFMAQNLFKPRKIVMSDWSIERLNSDQRNYAATDAWVGREIFYRMKQFTETRGLSRKFYEAQTYGVNSS